MDIHRLIANDPEDCRGLINTLITNGFVVWMAKVFDAETRRSNTIVFFTLWEKGAQRLRKFEVASTELLRDIELVSTEQLERIRQMWNNAKELEILHDTISSYEDDDPGSCPTYFEGVPCCLPRGHDGGHRYKCESPNCPGYTWPASARPHPSACYSETKSERVATVSEIIYCGTIKEGRQCILREGHKGDCLFICDDPSCPGYSWPASLERPHPTNTCQP